MRNLIGAGFREQTRLLSSVVLPQQSFRVETFSNPQYATADTIVLLAGGKTPGPSGRPATMGIPFDSASQGWIPFVMWIALFVATPLPWPKRWRMLLAGALVIEALVAATILVSLSNALASQAAPAWPRLPLMLANHLLDENIWFSFVPPFLLWAGWLAWKGHGEQLWAQIATHECVVLGAKAR